MPVDPGYTYGNPAALKEAERQVRAKFPNLIKGSSGRYRAVANRRRRIHA